VNRNERQRKDLTNIDELADSIRRLGLIHPIVITRDNVLVAGERRLAAIRHLRDPFVNCQYVDEVEPDHLKAIELEENIKRRDITWQDQVNALRAYHNLRASKEEVWSQEKTAEAIGLSNAHVTRMLQVADELALGNTRVADAPKLSTAHGIVKRKLERQDAQTLTKLKESIIGPRLGEAPAETILIEDFNVWSTKHVSPRFNFIHCDFPYGIDVNDFNQGAAPSFGSYTDSPETWKILMDSLKHTTINLTTPQAHLMFWFAMRKGDKRLYEATAIRLEAMGWDINPLPLIWVKSDGSGIIPDPERGPRQIYETCLFGSKGDRKIVSAVNNAYSAPIDHRFHMSTKPEPVLRHFFRMFVDENTVMLDPTCGSGSALRAADSLHAKFVLGLEINPEFAEQAREVLKTARALRRADHEIHKSGGPVPDVREPPNNHTEASSGATLAP